MTRTSRRSFIAHTAGVAAALAVPASSFASRETAWVDASGEIKLWIDEAREQIRAAMIKERIPGAAICLVNDRRPVWIEAFGTIDDKSRRPVDLDTIFSIQSTSKNMTTTAIMLAVQRGLLDLDKPIVAYLPEFTVNSRFDKQPQAKMTLRHLLSHRAGFTHEAPIGNDDDLSFPSFEAHVQSISDTWLRFPMGDRFRYSNLGVDLAGFILQTAMRKPFAACLKELLFDPLNMRSTTAETSDYMKRANRALGHVDGHETRPRALPFIPAGGIYASARDMVAYLKFHIDKGRSGGQALLQEPLWNEMHSFPFGGAYSLGVAGWKLRFGATNLPTFHHNGGGCGFGSVFRFYPEQGVGLAVLFNRGVGLAYGWGGALVDKILTRMYGAPQPSVRIEDFPAAVVSTETLGKYVGNWIGRETSGDFRIKEGGLFLKLGREEPRTRVLSSSEIAMSAGPNGNATHMTYFPATEGSTAHIETAFSFTHLDYNDGPNDAPGPNKAEWRAYEGKYWLHFWGKPAYEVIAHRQNGYLYLNGVRLVDELQPGLFFSSDGEAVDFRSDRPTWRSVPLRRA
ncbi:serine hydrolase domain-containing protein [Steroidobacter flavus]|uniref:Serine hydrolase domain-containing protein n=1 Tax=Steroidobacter flavus TaxID=1842136 RepID=A0ABV8T1Q6_9GAMM